MKDRRIISTLNNTQHSFTEDGFTFYEFIEHGVLNIIEINRKENFDSIIKDKFGDC